MMAVIPRLPVGVFGIEASGVIEKDELDQVVVQFQAAIRERYEQRLLLDFAEDARFSREAARDRFENRIAAKGPVERIALVGGERERRHFAEFVEHVNCEARTFAAGEREAALRWLVR